MTDLPAAPITQDVLTLPRKLPEGGLTNLVGLTREQLRDALIATGTPAGVGPMRPGQTVAVTVDGVGTLTNPSTYPGMFCSDLGPRKVYIGPACVSSSPVCNLAHFRIISLN